MKYAYPQNPTGSVTAIKRLDESSDSSTGQSNLERQQDIAVVGETVPLIFCQRRDWGGELGENGGVWISPRLIQLGIETTNLSMMYLLSQGKVEGLQISNTFWGYAKLTDKDPNASMCFAYESVPSCLDLDYVPGGSLGWTTTQTGPGPNLSGDSTYTFNTAAKVVKLEISFQSAISVSGNAQIVSGFGGYVALQKSSWDGRFYTKDEEDMSDEYWDDDPVRQRRSDPVTYVPAERYYQDPLYGYYQTCFSACWNHPGYTSSKSQYTRFLEYDRKHFSASWVETSEVRYNWAVIDKLSGVTVKSGQVWVANGKSSLTINDLPAGNYELVFGELYKERNRPVPNIVLGAPTGNAEQLRNSWTANYAGYAPKNQFSRYTYVGQESQQITSTITQTIYNQIDFPELPGGDQQIVGGLSDLTMLGIAGDITLLRPQEGPDYFMQAHVFVEQGIEVYRLLTDDVGPSAIYSDLVYYLMQKTQVLQADQIDIEALRLAAKLTQTYKLFFNGILQTTNSLPEWLIRTAPYFLLTPRQVDGKHGLWPVCPMNGAGELSRDPVVPSLVITADDIVANTYVRSYISPIDRRPVCLVMVYRDQPIEAVGQTVTVEVRYPGTALSGPWQSHDLTEFCCRPEQAVYAARYILAKRRYTTHTVSFTLGRRAAQLKPGDIVRVDLALDTTDGDGITDSIFYQLESLQEGQGGTVAIEATHFPVDANGVSVIARETHEGNVTIQ